jgi:hypothetical protein
MLADGSIAVFFIFGVLGLIIWAVIWGAKHQKAVRENWANFAQRYGLQYAGTTFGGISGWYGKASIRLNTITRGSGKNRSTYTQFHATINAPMPVGLVLYKEGLFSKLGKVFGGEDVQVGDPAIDNAFIIKAGDLLGAHRLLSIPQVKQALLYTIARHPGMRIEHRTVLWEESGVVHKPERLEAAAGDLAYIVETFDTAYQQLSGAPTQAPKAKSAGRLATAGTQRLGEPARTKSGRAPVVPENVRSSGAVVRHEDPAQRKAALAEVAAAFHALEEKTERGERVPEPPKPAPIRLEDAFAQPHLNEDVQPKGTGADAMKNYQPGQDVFTASDPGGAFEPRPETGKAAPKAKGEHAGSFALLVQSLADSNLMSRDREQMIERNSNIEWPVEIKVDRVDRSFGFDLPDALKDGRTVEGEVGELKVAVRFPPGRNAEIDKLRHGSTLNVRAAVAAWDDLFKKVTLNCE